MRPLVLGLAWLLTAGSAAGAVTIYDDPGGQIGPYLAKYRAVRASNEQVVIDGVCASACTMILGSIPKSRICATPRAVLVFHNAWDPSPSGAPVPNRAGNAILWSTYPRGIRKWLNRHGGLGVQTLYLQGPELYAIVRPCH